MPKPFLSVIIPVLNEAEGIRSQLEALQFFRGKGALLSVVDGGSDDGTAEQAGPLADQVIHSARGRALQMNAGAGASRSEVLLFLHVDTALPCSALDRVHDAITSGALWGRFDVRIDGANPVLRIVERLMNWRSRLSGIATGDQAIFVRREVFERIGGFPDLPLMEDIVLSKKLKRLASPACLRERVITSGRRWERQGVLRTVLLMWGLRTAFFFGMDPDKLAVRYGYLPRQR